MRKDGQTPYASHPMRVCLIVREVFGLDDPHMLMAALLHDTIEDTNTDYDDLAEQFGAEVASWAAALSKDKRLPDEQREQAYIEALQRSPWQVQICKLADVVDNLIDSARLTRDHRPRTLARARQYYDGLSQAPPAQLQGALAIVGALIDAQGQG
jgi:guanosine-3',5'-bis(diphosphate) 3'-pyrophosphohydrolase